MFISGFYQKVGVSGVWYEIAVSLVSGHMLMYLLFMVIWQCTCVVSGERLLYLCVVYGDMLVYLCCLVKGYCIYVVYGNTLLHLCSVCLKVSV